jgi:hypothetical protein
MDVFDQAVGRGDLRAAALGCQNRGVVSDAERDPGGRVAGTAANPFDQRAFAG